MTHTHKNYQTLMRKANLIDKLRITNGVEPREYNIIFELPIEYVNIGDILQINVFGQVTNDESWAARFTSYVCLNGVKIMDTTGENVWRSSTSKPGNHHLPWGKSWSHTVTDKLDSAILTAVGDSASTASDGQKYLEVHPYGGLSCLVTRFEC